MAFLGGVGDMDDGGSPLVKLPHHFQHFSPACGIQHGGGFIEDDHLQLHGDHAGDGQDVACPPER